MAFSKGSMAFISRKPLCDWTPEKIQKVLLPLEEDQNEANVIFGDENSDEE